MARNYGNDKKTALQAKTDAQKIAFAPMMFQAARALRDFGILKYLKEHNRGETLENIAEKTKTSPYAALVLLEAGLSMEMIYVKDDRYFLTKTGFFINDDPLTRANMDFTQDVNYKGFYHLQEALQNEKPSGLHKEFGSWKTVYEALPEMSPKFRKSWFGFDHYYSDGSFAQALPFVFQNKPRKILDIGGNTGKFALQCAAYHPEVEITLLDLPGQLEDAKKNIQQAGLQDRIHCQPINLLDFSKPYPEGYDVIWMSQFLDCFSEEEIVQLARNARQAMNKNTIFLVMETLWDKQRFEASTYSLHATSLYFTCLANGNSRMYHSDDMRRLLTEAGLVVEKIIENIGVSHTLIQCRIPS